MVKGNEIWSFKSIRLCSKSDLTNTTAKHLKLFFEMFGFQYNKNNFLDTRETKVVKINLILGK